MFQNEIDNKLIQLATGFLHSWHNAYIYDISLHYWQEKEAARKRYKELSAFFEPDGSPIKTPKPKPKQLCLF